MIEMRMFIVCEEGMVKMGLKSAQLLRLYQGLYLVELPNYGTVLLVFLVEYFRVLKVVDQVVQTLQAGVGQVADLNKRLYTFSDRNLAHLRLWKRL